MGYEVIRRRSVNCKGKARRRCRQRTRQYCNNRIESDHCEAAIAGDARARTTATAWVVIHWIEAANTIRKGQVLGITQQNLHGQAWVFGFLLGLR